MIYRIQLFAFAFFSMLLCSCGSSGVSDEEYATIVDDFISPADDNTLWCYWYWIGDDISKEGITKDIEAMKEAGIGAALIGNINPNEVDGKVPMLSEEWWGCMVHAVNEAKRVGIEIGAFNCPGWSQSGGPWITSEMAMRYLNYTETSIVGGKKVKIKLEKPRDEFQDVKVLAFPKSEFTVLDATNASISTMPKVKNQALLIDGTIDDAPVFTHKKHTIDITSKTEITARSLKLFPSDNKLIVSCDVQVKDGDDYKMVKTFNYNRTNFKVSTGAEQYAPVSVALPDVQASEFRLVCRVLRGAKAKGFTEIQISEEPIIEKYVEKHLGKMHPTPQPTWDTYSWESQAEFGTNELALAEAKVIDISQYMDADGLLEWDAPQGEWIVQRFGMSPTGTKNSPAAPQGKGYEVDKANRELIRFHFEQFIGEFLKRIPEESKSAFKYVIADSYEMGAQNWTDGFAQKFEAKYHYDPIKYLPVFSGRVVGSVAESERFLWDLRRAVADGVAYEYCGGLREISNENGLKLWLENYGHWGFPSEFMLYGGQSDFVSGEYWNEGTLGNIECKAASSTAHAYGKGRTSAECFTAGRRTYVRHPKMLKRRGDWSLTEGINHHVLHLYIHQPDDNRVPGVNAWFSTEFNRHNTWFKQGKHYFDYLRRAQHLLQQGKYAADVCYFIGEDAPIMTGATNPALPKGYSFDYINADVILNRLSVKDGDLVLPDGMTYQMMVLPQIKTMRPELLAKLESLVAQGAIIYGQPPLSSPSLVNYPACDDELKALTDKMWGQSDEAFKAYGNGYVVDGAPLQEALDYFNIAKDVIVNDDVLWTHRTMPGMEIYFLSNQGGEEISITPSFRVSGMKAQLWDAVTGEIRALGEASEVDGRTIVPLKMENDRSWFVIFTNNENEMVRQALAMNAPKYNVCQTLDKPWKIDFQNKRIAPTSPMVITELQDWSKSDDDVLKHYSGTATYRTTFDYNVSDAKEVFIDLGKVGVMASVTLNGTFVGNTWMAPYRLNVTDAIKEGDNRLEIEVVNVWRNRLTGDMSLKDEEKTTWLNVDGVKLKEHYVSSGLIGPVTIQEIE